MPSRIVYSVRDKSRELLERLKKAPSTMRELYAACSSRSEVVATFLAVLDRCRSRCVSLIDGSETTVCFEQLPEDELHTEFE